MPDWTPDSWQNRKFVLGQQPDWPDPAARDDVLKRLKGLPPLIYAGEARVLMDELARAAQGEAFVLQAGDCAETFADFSADRVRDLLKTILQVAVVLTWSSGVPVIKIGRVAGQFAKPRTAKKERLPDSEREVDVYRGDMVNSLHLSEESRRPDPENILRAYEQAALTLNLVRGFAEGGFADLASVHNWTREFVASSREGRRYEAVASGIDSALRFMKACKIDSAEMHRTRIYASHEALLLSYEEALTRQDSTAANAWYDCSAHMVWIGTRTKQLDSAHVEFLRGVGNPIGLKIGPDIDPEQLLKLCDQLNPERRLGRLTLISRMGIEHIRTHLPKFIDAIEEAQHPVLWMCDPMHGNTYASESGLKTRHFDDLLAELTAYFEIHREKSTWPGGIHLELTGENVTECLGGSDELQDHELHRDYQTACDPRLNARQSLDLAFRVAELLQDFQAPEARHRESASETRSKLQVVPDSPT